jgi:FkbM family methyltransferase
MRNGARIFLSQHAHDVITSFIIFGREDYGSIKKGSIIIDIGGNIGTFALFAAFSGAAKVYTFEPNAESFDILCKNVSFNKLENIILPFKYAVSDSDGEKVLIPTGSSPYNTMQPVTAGTTDTGSYETVETISLNSFCKENNIENVDLIKIDCEGAEFQIIPNLAPELLKRVRNIKVEYQDGDVNILLNHLITNGFTVSKHIVDDRMNGGMLWMEK